MPYSKQPPSKPVFAFCAETVDYDALAHRTPHRSATFLCLTCFTTDKTDFPPGADPKTAKMCAPCMLKAHEEHKLKRYAGHDFG